MNNEKKTKSFKKATKPLILAACVAVVGISVYADWSYTRKNVNEPESYIYNTAVSGDRAKILGEATFVGITNEMIDGEQQEGYFATAAYERQRSRDETLELLQTVVDSSESMPDAKNKALENMTQIASYMESEANIETLIKAKGFDDCVTVISDNGVNVIVKTTGLLTYEVAQIREIVMNELNIPVENIKIIEKNN